MNKNAYAEFAKEEASACASNGLRSRQKTVYGRTRYQKLIFLADKELGTNWYHFYPHDYGPFSKDLYEDLEDLIDVGFVEERAEKNTNGLIHYKYTLTPRGEVLVWDVLKYLERHGMRSQKSVKNLLRRIEKLKRDYCFKNLELTKQVIDPTNPDCDNDNLTDGQEVAR